MFVLIPPTRTKLLFLLLPALVGALLSLSLLDLATRTAAAKGSAAPAVFNGRIAFVSTRNSDAFNIWVMNPDGSFAVRLTDDESGSDPFSTYDFDPAWSPDGTKIAFVSNRESNFEIFTMNADGSNVQQLTNDGVQNGQPKWSPDGTKIAFTRGGGCVILLNPALKSRMVPADDNPCVPYIYVMNADGSNKTKISQGENEAWPVWSPDGTKLAFATVNYMSADGNEIYVMNANGTNRTRLTNDSFIDFPTSWSPDGNTIAFTSNRDTPQTGIFRFQLYTMNANGTNRVRLVASAFDDQYPVFSPDGTKIAFQRSFETQSGASPTSELYVMNADGSDQKNITNNSAEDFGPPGWQPLASPLQVPPPAILQFSPVGYSVSEAAGSVQITVNRSGALNEPTTVRYATSDGNADARHDYTDAFGVLSFAPGETNKTITLLLTDDAYVEGTESFYVDLSDVTGNAILGNDAVAVINLGDNDTAPAGNPIDDSQFFVRQHYHDFFNREPDAAGLSFWVNNIEACGTDVGCRDAKRVDTSAAFFLSIEFQDTGFYIYRLHSGALMFPPNYVDFIRDSQEISRGLIVGAPGWEALLDANTQKFTEEFVTRTRFKVLYPDGLTAEQYVDGLYTRLLVTPPPAERNEAIAAFGSGDTVGRARALRIVTNNADYKKYVFNTSFVAMQYYGYLRRDIDFDGFVFWFNKLQQFNGDFRKAEMVKAFITSGEYRQRFGPP